MSDLYILDGRTPVPCEDPLAWGRWMAENDAATLVGLDHVGAAYVSTRFGGLDMNISRVFMPELPPILFETMAFDAGGEIVFQARAVNWEEAEFDHAVALKLLRRMVNG